MMILNNIRASHGDNFKSSVVNYRRYIQAITMRNSLFVFHFLKVAVWDVGGHRCFCVLSAVGRHQACSYESEVGCFYIKICDPPAKLISEDDVHCKPRRPLFAGIERTG